MIVVFDTNIYLAAIGMPTGLCFELFSIIKERPETYRLFISDPIRKELAEKTGALIDRGIIKMENVESFSILMNSVAQIIESKEAVSHVKADPDDDRILECAAACGADLIITMDRHLLKIKNFRNIGIIHPKTFLYSMEK